MRAPRGVSAQHEVQWPTSQTEESGAVRRAMGHARRRHNAADRYQKFLPEWMRGNNSAATPPRPPRPRRARPARPAGGYTPGKFALND